MEKISGILPATKRITTVDLKNSGTARPGMPSFGRAVGLSSVAERELARQEVMGKGTAIPRDISGQASVLHKEQVDWRSQQLDPRAEIVQRMADDFFVNKSRQYEQTQAPLEAAAADQGAIRDPESYIEAPVQDSSSAEADGEEMLVTGQYLDVQA